MSDDYKPYSAKRWTDIPKPIPSGGKRKPLTDEEQKEADRRFEEVLRQYGIIKENETIENWKHTM